MMFIPLLTMICSRSTLTTEGIDWCFRNDGSNNFSSRRYHFNNGSGGNFSKESQHLKSESERIKLDKKIDVKETD
jgi:hypothetical protein